MLAHMLKCIHIAPEAPPEAAAPEAPPEAAAPEAFRPEVPDAAGETHKAPGLARPAPRRSLRVKRIAASP